VFPREDGPFGVGTISDVIWGSSKFPKMGVNKQFEANKAKYKNRNISETINPIRAKFEINLRPTIAHHGWSTITQIKSNMAAGHHLEKNDTTS